MTSPTVHMVREKKDVLGQIKSEWLGAETRVHLPPRTLAGNRSMRWSRQVSVRILLLSFSCGLAMGGCLALFARGRFRSRHRRVGHGRRGESFRASREVAPCLACLD